MAKQWSNIQGIVLIIFLFLMVLAADILIVYTYHRVVRSFLSEQPEHLHADAGVVFFGDYIKDGTELGPDSKNRARLAIELYKKGNIQSIICVGGYDIHQWKGKPHLMKQFLRNNGIPSQVIWHDSLSFNTITNWQEAIKIIKTNRFDTVIAISAPLHIYRISKLIGSDQVYYCAYQYKFSGFSDYWQIYKDTHREFLSRLLSFALNDRLRNRMVHIYRTIGSELDRVL
jgi:vancomycin permeability regulator SanA